MNLRGCGTALVTPLQSDGSLDQPTLRKLVEWQVASKIDFLVPCGTTGETPTLAPDEIRQVIETTVEVAAGKVPIVAGATSNSTREAVEKAKAVAKIKGVDAILTASPYYNKPTQEGQYQHFAAITGAVEKPLVLYNVPGRTGANIEPATLARLAEIANIIAVKEASGSITQIAEVCNAVPDGFRDAIKFGAAALCYQSSQRWQQAAMMQQQFVGALGLGHSASDKGKISTFYSPAL